MDENQKKAPIVQNLKEYIDNNVIYFDVPGHKKNISCDFLTEFFGENIVQMDVNSSKGMDNLSTPKGSIKEANTLMAKAYGADYAYLLVNGSTIGIQAMIMSVCRPNDKIILPRNVHKSVINALILGGAIPVYIRSEIDEKLGIITGVKYDDVKRAIENNKDAKAILLLNPTYYGITVNIAKICELAHDNNMVVLVDEAHGAHFAFHKNLPKHAMEIGADAAVASMHKSTGSLTQSSILMVKDGFIDNDKIRLILNLLQTTSASYILMSSLDLARRNMVLNGERIISNIMELSKFARKLINELPNMKTLSKDIINGDNIFDVDETKLVVNVSKTGYTGFEIYDMLYDEFNIQVEVADINSIMAIISIGDTKENIEKLVNALEIISTRSKDVSDKLNNLPYIEPEVVISPREAYFSDKKRIKLEEAENEISTESIMVYPPGIPVVSPGERIKKEMIDYIKFIKDQKCVITDLADDNIEYINVIRMDK